MYRAEVEEKKNDEWENEWQEVAREIRSAAGSVRDAQQDAGPSPSV